MLQEKRKYCYCKFDCSTLLGPACLSKNSQLKIWRLAASLLSPLSSPASNIGQEGPRQTPDDQSPGPALSSTNSLLPAGFY